MIRFAVLLLVVSLLGVSTATAQTCADLVQIARENTRSIGAEIPDGEQDPYGFIQFGDALQENTDYSIGFGSEPGPIDDSCFFWEDGKPEADRQGIEDVFLLPFYMMAFAPTGDLSNRTGTWAPNVKFSETNNSGKRIAPRWRLANNPTLLAGTSEFDSESARIGVWTTPQGESRLLVVVCTSDCEDIFGDYPVPAPQVQNQAQRQGQNPGNNGDFDAQVVEPALSIQKILEELMPSDFVNLSIVTEDGTPVDAAELQTDWTACTILQTNFATVLQSLYSRDCLQLRTEQEYTLNSVVPQWTDDGSRLNVLVTVTPVISPFLSTITITAPAQREADVDCVIDYRLTDAATDAEMESGFFNPTNDTYSIIVGGNARIEWRDVKLEILPSDDEASNCIPDSLGPVSLTNLEENPNISLDSNGNLMITGIGIRNNRKELHIILNTAAGTLENSGAGTRVNYPWANEPRDLQTFASEFIVDAITAYQEQGYDTAIVHAIGESQTLEMIGEYSISATADRSSVVDQLFDALEPRNVAYSDAAVGLYLRDLFLDDDKVLLFGRSGFTEEQSAALCNFSQDIRDLDIDLSALTLSKVFSGATLENVGIAQNQRDSFVPLFGCEQLSGAGNAVVFPQKRGAGETDRREVYLNFLNGAKDATQDFLERNQPNNGE